MLIMKKYLFLLIAVLLALQAESCFSQKSKHIYPAEDWKQWFSFEDAGYDQVKMTSIRRFIIDSMNTTGVVVVVEGKVLATYGDIVELSYLASCRKSILAMLYGNYVKQGMIDLDKSLGEIGMDDHQGLLPIEKKATVHHLITARSGIYHPASNAGDNSADAPERGSQEPGTYFLYNNWDFNAAGAAFEKLTGHDIYDALEKDLAIPIGMQDFRRDSQHKSGNLMRSKYPAYHIWLSTRDMARLGYLMLRNGNWDGKQVIPKDWAERIVSIVTPTGEMNPYFYRNGDFGYGYMWWIWDGEAATGAFEGAYTARGAYGQYITVLPTLDMVIAHKTKAEYGRRTSWGNYQKLLHKIVDARVEHPDLAGSPGRKR
jgi:CubicO group peptidase (beta-lactamase class C family)